MVTVHETANDPTNGLGVLTPTACDVTEELNGDFALELEHPIDDAGKWARLTAGRWLRAPCTVPSVPNERCGLLLLRPILGVANGTMAEYTITGNADAGYTVTPYDPNDEILLPEAREGASGRRLRDPRDITIGGVTYYERVRTFYDFVTEGDVYSQTSALYYTLSPGASVTLGAPVCVAVEPEYGDAYYLQGQITNQFFKIYRMEKGISSVKVWAKHQFYEMRHCRPSYATGTATAIATTAVPTIDYTHGLYTALQSISAVYFHNDFSLGTTSRVGELFSDTAGMLANLEKWALDANLVDIVMGNGGLLKAFGVELYRSDNIALLLPRIGTETGVVIREGKNLKGVTIEIDQYEVVRTVYPYGKDANDKYRPLRYFNSAASNFVGDEPTSGTPFVPLLVDDAKVGSTNASGATLTKAMCAAMLTDAANALLAEKGEPEVSVDVDFELAEYLEEYADVKGLERVFLGDSVRVISERLGVDTMVRVNAYVFDCIALRYKRLSMESDMRRKGLLGTISKYVAGGDVVNNFNATGGSASIEYITDAQFGGLLT